MAQANSKKSEISLIVRVQIQEGMYRSLVQRQMISVGDNGSELEMAGEVPTEGQEETLSGDGTDGAAGPSTGRWSRTRMVGDGRGGSPRTMVKRKKKGEEQNQ